MALDDRIRVAVAFGGVSPEHEVSVITGHQVLAAMDRDRFLPLPLYVGKDGHWYTGGRLANLEDYSDLDAVRSSATPVIAGSGVSGQLLLVPRRSGGFLRRMPPAIPVDVMFLAFHGGAGEDGAIQGLCESLGVAYTGSGVLASAVGMDKVVSKQLCRAADIPVVDYVGLSEWDWGDSEDEWLDTAERHIGYPVVVKPARLGSSIGIEIARDRTSLDHAIEEAFRFDSKIVLERAVENLTEINCSVLGNAERARVSLLEQPIRSDDERLLTFADKYQRHASGKGHGATKTPAGTNAQGMASLDRIIPAPLDAVKEREIQDIANRVFSLFNCSGVARIDFLIDDDTGTVYFNEINTIPGSFSFYLWDPAGIDFTALVNELIELAIERRRTEGARVRSYDVNLLSEGSVRGLKSAKGGA